MAKKNNGIKKSTIMGIKSKLYSAAPSAEEIARRAYQRFEERGCVHGSDVDDWLGAENDLNARRTRPTN